MDDTDADVSRSILDSELDEALSCLFPSVTRRRLAVVPLKREREGANPSVKVNVNDSKLPREDSDYRSLSSHSSRFQFKENCLSVKLCTEVSEGIRRGSANAETMAAGVRKGMTDAL